MNPNLAPRVWRMNQVDDVRETSGLVLLRRGEDRLWLDPRLAIVAATIARQILDCEEAEREQDAPIIGVGWRTWAICAGLAAIGGLLLFLARGAA